MFLVDGAQLEEVLKECGMSEEFFAASGTKCNLVCSFTCVKRLCEGS